MDTETEDILAHRPPSSASPALADTLLDLVVSHRRHLKRALLFGILVSAVIAFLIPKQFESTVKIMPPETQNPAAMLAAASGKLPAGIGELASGLIGLKNPGPLYLDLLRSRTVLDHQVDRFNLRRVYWSAYQYRARKKLASRTELSEDRKSGVITIVVTDGDPARAKALAEGYVTELDQLLTSVSTSAARRERIFVEHRLATVTAELDAAEREFSQFASRNSTLDIKEQTKAMVTASAELQGRIVAANAELQGLEQTYTDSNIRVRSLKARIAELNRQLGKISGTGDVNGTALATGEMYPPIRQLPILGVEWANLYRRVKIQETVFELLTQQYEIAKVQEAREIPSIRVIDPPDYPERKSWPPRLLLILIGAIFSVAATLAWIWISCEWAHLEADDPWRLRLRRTSELLPDRLVRPVQ
jgi:uncharacterized protein involved in exopolysaccharide biosynthesis